MVRGGSSVAAAEFVQVKVYLPKSVFEGRVHQGIAVLVFFVSILEQATAWRNHQIAASHDGVVFHIDVTFLSVACKEFLAVVVLEEGIELLVGDSLTIAKGHLTQNLVLGDTQGSDLVHQGFVKVVLVDYRINLEADPGIQAAQFRELAGNVFEIQGLACALAAYTQIGLMVEGVDGDSHLGQHVGHRVDVFQVAAVGDDRYVGSVLAGGLDGHAGLLGKEHRFPAHNAQAPGGCTGAKILAMEFRNVFDNRPDIGGIVPDFTLVIPLGIASVATIIASFGNVPVDDERGVDSIHRNLLYCVFPYLLKDARQVTTDF